MAASKRTTAWYADTYVKRYGFHLIPIKPNSKLPLENDWGNNTHTTGDHWKQNPDHNVGLSLGQSNMCSLDIDCMESFKVILDEFGIDTDELDKLPTVQGAN